MTKKKMQLRGSLFYQYRALMAETNELATKASLADSTLVEYSKKPELAEVFLAMNFRDKAVLDYQAKRREFGAVQLKVAKKFGIKPQDLGNYAIDPETGVMKYAPKE